MASVGRQILKAAAREPSLLSYFETAIDWTFDVGKRIGRTFFEPIPEGVGPTNLIEELTLAAGRGYRLKPAARIGIGTAMLVGAPAFGGTLGVMTMTGRIRTEPLQYREYAPVVGASYAPRTGPNHLGATGDLALALHALR